MTTERGTRLNNKVAIVTGAGATGSGEFVGIGQAISILFAGREPRYCWWTARSATPRPPWR